MDKQDLVRLASAIARTFNLHPELVCAICEQESSWNPSAGRYEKGFYNKYENHPDMDEQERLWRSSSWGLMQIMGETARYLGYSGPLDQLLVPEIGLAWGCKYLENRIAHAEGNIEKALLLWNGGGNAYYPHQVLARVAQYQKETNVPTTDNSQTA